MDLLNPNVPLDVWDESWKIYSRTAGQPPHHISNLAHVENSMITEGCEVDGHVEFSVLFSNVKVAAGAVVRDSIIMPGAVIEEGAQVGEIPELLQNPEDWGVAVIGSSATVKSNSKVEPGAMIESGKEV